MGLFKLCNNLFVIFSTCFFFFFISKTAAATETNLIHHPILKINSSHYKDFPNSLHSQDFFIKINPGSLQNTLQSDLNSIGDSCRENIAKVICLVDPGKEGQDPETRPCLEGSENYTVYFEQVYDAFPRTIQKMFCSLKHIYIEKKFLGTAYASPITDSKGLFTGAFIGIRKSVLDENLTLATWASWKEQLSFGGITDSYTVSPNLPIIRTYSQSKTINDFLYFVIAHEFGHIFDFANKINSLVNCSIPGNDEDDPVCEFTPESWGTLSWTNSQTPTQEDNFPLREKLCFYTCTNTFITPNETNKLYAGLAGSSFISTYAATNPWDDFADSLAYFLMNENLNTDYSINTHQGLSIDSMMKLKSVPFQKKYDYIKNFLNRTGIVYP